MEWSNFYFTYPRERSALAKTAASLQHQLLHVQHPQGTCRLIGMNCCHGMLVQGTPTYYQPASHSIKAKLPDSGTESLHSWKNTYT